jgi:hypothetical protein
MTLSPTSKLVFPGEYEQEIVLQKAQNNQSSTKNLDVTCTDEEG